MAGGPGRWVMTGKGERLVRVPMDALSPGPDEVLIEIAGCGVCRTDLSIYYDDAPTRHELPLTLGHEISGHVIEAGDNALWWVDRAVVVPALIPCGHCDTCRRGRAAICPNQKMPGNDIHGGFATHIVVPAHGLCEVDEVRLAATGIELADLAVVADAATSSFQAVVETGVGPGDLVIVNGVGSSEMGHLFLTNLPDAVEYGTSGVPVTGYDMRLVDERGRDVAEGEIGELIVRGQSAAMGYWNQREKSRRTFEGEWTRTGDKYQQRADGVYIYCGRADDMFKVSGIWVSPFEVEAALIAHPRVLEAAVVPAEDANGLIKPRAFVVLKDQSEDRRSRALHDELKPRSARGNIRAGSNSSTACRRRRRARSSVSCCARPIRLRSIPGTAGRDKCVKKTCSMLRANDEKGAN